MELLKRFIREDSGQDLVEYGLLIALIVVGTVVLFPTIATKMGQVLTGSGTDVHGVWIPYCPGSTTTTCP